MCKVDVPDAVPCELVLADGTHLPMHCDAAGLIDAFDFTLEDGSIIRQERRLVEVVPGVSQHDRRKPVLSGETVEQQRTEKALFWARWNGFSASERANFLARCVHPTELQQALDNAWEKAA